MDTPDTKSLLDAALRREWAALGVNTGISVPRLAQMTLRAIDDPDVIAAYPVECRQLRERRATGRTERRAPKLSVQV